MSVSSWKMIGAFAVALGFSARASAATLPIEVCNRASDPIQLTDCKFVQKYAPALVFDVSFDAQGASRQVEAWIAVEAVAADNSIVQEKHARGGSLNQTFEIAWGHIVNIGNTWNPVKYQCWLWDAGVEGDGHFKAPWAGTDLYKIGSPPIGSRDYVCTRVGDAAG